MVSTTIRRSIREVVVRLEASVVWTEAHSPVRDAIDRAVENEVVVEIPT